MLCCVLLKFTSLDLSIEDIERHIGPLSPLEFDALRTIPVPTDAEQLASTSSDFEEAPPTPPPVRSPSPDMASPIVDSAMGHAGSGI